MAGDEVGAVDQVRRVDRPRAEPHVRDGDRAGFLRVVDEVALGVHRRVFADDLDRVLAGADRAVAAQSVEHGPRHVVGLGRELRVPLQAQVRHVVDDADGEVPLRLVGRQLVEDAGRHGRRELLGRQPVAAADDRRGSVANAGRVFDQRGDDVLIQRLAERARFLRPIEHGDPPHRWRQRVRRRPRCRTGGRAGP